MAIDSEYLPSILRAAALLLSKCWESYWGLGEFSNCSKKLLHKSKHYLGLPISR